MGYTVYWNRTKKAITEEFVRAVKSVIDKAIANGIMIRGFDGTEEPVVTMDEISFNGDKTRDVKLGCEACWFDNDEENTGFNFCKTREYPYDAVVKEVVNLALKMGIVNEIRDDGYVEKLTDEQYITKYHRS